MKKYTKHIIVLIAMLLVLLMSGCGTGQGGKQQGSKSPQSGQSQTNENLEQGKQGTGGNNQENDKDYIKAGMYKVGTDLKAGEYILYSTGSLAFYQVSKDSTGSLESIITNDNFPGTRYVTVSDGQYLQINNARALPVEKAPVQKPENGVYKEGMYKVGRDIKAGEYKVISDGGMAYVEVRMDSLGSIEGISMNDNFEGEKYVTVKNGQYIKLMGCHIAAK